MKTVIEMARKAGLVGGPVYARGLEKFAELVRAQERDECAVIAETPISGEQDDITMEAKDRIAAAIRARGNT